MPKMPINKGILKEIECQIPVLKVLGLNPNGITEGNYRETPINKGFLDISYKEIQFPFLVLISKFEPRNRRKIAAKMALKTKIAAKSPQKIGY